MEPFFFGTSPKTLFGVYHPPHSEMTRATGVVCCYPMGHEYVYAHRSFFRLALLLSSAGFHVLRFDFYGCGDSEGDRTEGEILQWVDDISTAVEEIKGGCSLERICVVGLRLGGTLSMIAGVERGDIDCMVFWDPVISGKTYIKELMTSHKRFLQFSGARSRDRAKGKRQQEILGFPITDSLVNDLEKLDLLTLQQKPANNVLLIKSSEKTDDGSLRKHLQKLCEHLDYQHIPAPEAWIRKDDKLGTGLVPIEILQAVVSWISKVVP